MVCAGGLGGKAAAADEVIGEVDLEGGWGDDELGLPGDDAGERNGAVATGAGDDEDGGWEMEVRKNHVSIIRYSACCSFLFSSPTPFLAV